MLIQQPDGSWARIATLDNGDGTMTLSITAGPSNSSVLVAQPNGEWAKLATVLADGIHTLSVSDALAAQIEDWRLSYLALAGSYGPKTPVTVTPSNPNYAASNADVGSIIRVTANPGFVDFEGFSRNEGVIFLDIVGTAVAASGYSGENWRGTGPATNRLALAAGIYVVFRSQADYVCVQLPIFSTSSAATWPVFALLIGWFGQSYAQRTDDSGNRGFEATRETLGLTKFCQFVRGMPVGASRVTKGPASGGFLWDQDTALPAANYTTALNAYNTAAAAFPTGSGYPAMSDVFWMHGANEFDDFAAAGPVTPAILTTSYQAAAAKFRTDTSLAGLRFWILPWCGTDDPERGPAAYAQRRAQLDACNNVLMLRGPDYYDIPRADGIHQSPEGMSRIGQRLALYHARKVSAANVFIGSSIVDIDANGRGCRRIAARQFRVYMDRFGGASSAGLNVAPITRPDNPIGFAIHASSDFFTDPLFPVGFRWGADGAYTTLDLFTTQDTDTPFLAYPYGSVTQASIAQTRIVRTLDRALGVTWPLATFHPTVGLPV